MKPKKSTSSPIITPKRSIGFFEQYDPDAKSISPPSEDDSEFEPVVIKFIQPQSTTTSKVLKHSDEPIYSADTDTMTDDMIFYME
jgi:hypothetical protein